MTHPLPLARGLLTGAVLAVGGAAGTVLAAAATGAPAALLPALAVAVSVALTWAGRRTLPATAVGVAVATAAALVVAGEPYGPAQAVVALACFAAGQRLRPARAAAVCGLGAAVLVTALATRLDMVHPQLAVAVLAGWASVFAGIPALVGALAAARVVAAQRGRASLLARGAAAERARIAREVHDIAGHGFAVVALQAGVALTVLDDEPAAARRFLETIHASSEQALRELRAALHAIDEAPAATDVPALVGRLRAGGLPVDLAVAGPVHDLGPETSTAVYRVVQEALTNVVRHAGPTSAGVTLDVAAGGVSVCVVDGGPGGTGRGIGGLRARVAALGGTLEAGPAGRGFAVRARLPEAAP